jgi:acyl carrier protein phosphodiesterase
MNYLAHAFLSFGDEPILVGNLIADFIKGKKQLELIPDKIQQGVMLHRNIDKFTDEHPVVKQSIERIKLSQGRYASVAVDIYYDYFLAKQWNSFSETPLQQFANLTYLQLQNHYAIMPEKGQIIFSKMIEHNWLMGYSDLNRIHFSFQRLAQRTSFDNNLLQATSDLKLFEKQLYTDFNLFFPDLMEYVLKKSIYY